MKKIFKYTLDVVDSQTLEIPFGYKWLTCQMQGRELCLWAEVSPEAIMVRATIAIFGTGHAMPASGLTYIATVQQGNLVWHIYEQK